MEPDLPRFVNVLMQKHRLDVSRFESGFLEKTIQKRQAVIALNTAEEYCDYLITNTNEASLLYTALGISYSEFFRHSLTFGVLEHLVIPELIRIKKRSSNKEIRIWSAACAAGQEAYSMAILLEELNHKQNSAFPYRIFASDQSHDQIELAKRGVFSNSAVQNISSKRLSQWFTKSGPAYTVSQPLKMNIEFSVFDIFTESMRCPPGSIFGDFDIVICANMMLYYSADNQKQITQKLEKCISPGGMIVTGDTEREIMFLHGYEEVYLRSAVFKKI